MWKLLLLDVAPLPLPLERPQGLIGPIRLLIHSIEEKKLFSSTCSLVLVRGFRRLQSKNFLELVFSKECRGFVASFSFAPSSDERSTV